MPKAFPLEFCNDVVAVARKGEAPLTQIAKDFVISEACLHRWLTLAAVEDGIRPGVTKDEAAEIRELRKCNRSSSRKTRSFGWRRRSSLVSRSQSELPAGPGTGCRWDPCDMTLTCRVLGLSKQAFYEWRADPVTDREWGDAHLINTAMDIHADDPAFGYRFIADQLVERAITAAENRVQRLCPWACRGVLSLAGPLACSAPNSSLVAK
jgi:putative transposase